MIPNVLVDLEFSKIITEASAQTQTGAEIITKYQTYLLANPESCGIVNQFVQEASQCQYDNGVYECLSRVSDYIQSVKTSWALASACESIMKNDSSHNLLQRNAAHQVEKLLEQEEENVVKYIRAGALKNVMFCESFRNIVKQVFSEQPIIEHQAEYTKFVPFSLIESVGDGYCFTIAGSVYKMDDAKNVSEAQWSEVSNTFRTVSSLLNASITEVEADKFTVNYLGAKYVLETANTIIRTTEADSREYTVEQFRDFARMQVMASNPRKRNDVAQVMEAIALMSENLDQIVSIDMASIYTTAHDKFLVIESGNDLYATLLSSNRHAKWTIQEDAIQTLSFIKSKTNTELGSEYQTLVESTLERQDVAQKEDIERQLQENEERSIKERIEALTEKFKNDPTKLAVLAKLAADLQE